MHIRIVGWLDMNRTIVCTACDNNRVTIRKVGQELYIKCSKCGNTIMQAVHLESWNKNIDNTYKLRISIEDDRLFEADMNEIEFNNKKSKASSKEETKIKLIYNKKYEYIRELEEDESTEISIFNTPGYGGI